MAKIALSTAPGAARSETGIGALPPPRLLDTLELFRYAGDFSESVQEPLHTFWRDPPLLHPVEEEPPAGGRPHVASPDGRGGDGPTVTGHGKGRERAATPGGVAAPRPAAWS